MALKKLSPARLSPASISGDEPPTPPGLEHPLFAPRDDEEAPEVGSFHVQRFESTGLVMFPRLFANSDLRTLEEFAALFGGGRYELIARDRTNQRITAKRSLTLYGDPKPFLLPGDKPATSAALAPIMPAIPQRAAPEANPMWMTLLTVLMPLLAEYLKSSSAERQAQVQQNQQMMLMMIQQMQASGDAHMKAMVSLHSRPGSSSSEEFMKGVEFMQSMLEAKMAEQQEQENGGDAGMMKSIGEGLAMLQQLQSIGSGSPPPATGGVS